MGWRCSTALVLLALAGWISPAWAHPTEITTLEIKVESDGRFSARLNVDLLAYALGKTSADATNEELEALLDEPRPQLARRLVDAGERFRREVVIQTNLGDVSVTSWALPTIVEVDAAEAGHVRPRITIGSTVTFSGSLPAGTTTLAIRLPYILGDTLQAYELPRGRSVVETVLAGEYGKEVTVTAPAAKSP